MRGFMRVDGWICVTNYQADLIRHALGQNPPPVTAISQGVDTRFFDPEPASPEQSSGYILAVGAEMRDYPLLLEAVRDLPVETVIQASSAWMTTLRGSLQRLPSNVTLHAERLTYGELRDLYRNALLVVVPLHDTPQAAGITTILEAMSMRRCVVATRSRGLPDILIPGQTGAISEPAAAALAASISTLSASPERREALAETGRGAVVAMVSIEEHAKQVTDFIISTGERKST
jgi:glycosyltransferase involved in cell wall biosynthesis